MKGQIFILAAGAIALTNVMPVFAAGQILTGSQPPSASAHADAIQIAQGGPGGMAPGAMSSPGTGHPMHSKEYQEQRRKHREARMKEREERREKREAHRTERYKERPQRGTGGSPMQ